MITYGARKGTGPRAPESISAPVCIWDEYMVTEDEYPGTENPCNQSAPFEEGTDHDHDSETESDVHAPPPAATKTMKAPPPAAAALPAAAAPASGSKNPTGKVPNGSKTGNATKSVQTDPTTAGDIDATKAVLILCDLYRRVRLRRSYKSGGVFPEGAAAGHCVVPCRGGKEGD